ncbi:hypothetical protein jhhlp_003330 [Lomentospora prolificans]|uniref:Uncharacterized protein n=1 Tax=Lomentospora prolificans TaxID=41688 RepID=A0A2N3NGL1_9PEZI|nr:hypothetical protein jhhlp_003330 [Lomentospora prolificans]
MKASAIAVLLSAGSLASAAPKCKPRTITPKPEALEPIHFKDLGAQRAKFRYGPFLVPGVHDPETMGMKEFQGPIDLPCTDCYVTNFLAGLEFEDGSNANAHTGMWLHHTVFLDASQTDPTCDTWPLRIFASGNERTVLDISNNGTRNVGVYLPSNSNVTHITELMNESALSRAAYLTVDYEFLPAASAPASFRPALPIWLDISGTCSNGQYNVTTDDPVFDAEIAWDATVSGEILNVIGHLHDGGVRQDFSVNGELACEHTARYGEAAEFITHVGMYGNEETGEDGHDHGDGSHSHDDGEPGHDHGEGEGETGHDHGQGAEGEAEHDHADGGHDHGSDGHIMHISSIRTCRDLGRFAVGDELSIKAYYNFTQHQPMAGHHGGLEPVMGISILYVLEDEE